MVILWGGLFFVSEAHKKRIKSLSWACHGTEKGPPQDYLAHKKHPPLRTLQ